MFVSNELQTGLHHFVDGWTFEVTAYGTLEYVPMVLEFME